MAVTDAYATDIQYKAARKKTSGDDDSEVDVDLLAISRFIDRKLGRFFTKDAAVVAHRYYPTTDYQRTLYVDDIASTVGLVVRVDDNRDGTPEVTLAQTTDFELRPLNAAVGSEPAPYTQLYLPPRVSRRYWFELVEVTAIHGWPSVPAAIQRACIELTGILRLENPRATSRIPEAIDSALGASPTAQRIVDDLLSAYAKPAWIFA